MPYSNLVQLRDVLAGAPPEGMVPGGERIDFGPVVRDLQPNPNNTNELGFLFRVRMDDSFSGKVIFSIEFTSTTDFRGFYKVQTFEVKVPLTTGSVNTTYAPTNPQTDIVPPPTLFEIESSFWSAGPFGSGDVFSWEVNAPFSFDAINRIGNVAAVMIDSWLAARGRIEITDFTQRFYEANPVDPAFDAPPTIQEAHSHLWAYLFFHRNLGPNRLGNSPVREWWQIARDMTVLHHDTLDKPAARIISRQPVIASSINDKLGSPVFGFDLELRQGKEITVLDVLNRFKEWDFDVNHLGHVSESASSIVNKALGR